MGLTRLGAALTGVALLGACSGTPCRTTDDALAALRDGMTYQEVAQVIGCPGTVTQNTTGDGSQAMIVRWSGPGSSTFSYTRVTFRNGRMTVLATNSGG